ncbi:DNA helicase [Camelimonas fluminis]|uniref:DUF3320 domain-containing protein n=1 Tax=Camelimonas fluminis TaxID=1576911 RepID=A0ABV7UN60_9HYPH|nr:DUF3320 domain-containing protein [Camelimonas fluminis]GHE78774.1 DNA helicase [Camelimonas fluminis]
MNGLAQADAQLVGGYDVVVEADIVGRVNFASAQNGVSVLRQLVVRNLSAAPLENLTVTLTGAPAIFRHKSWKIDRIAAGGEMALRDRELALDHQLLAGLDEAEVGRLTIAVHAPDGLLLEEHHAVDMLARDEWGGVNDMAALLAAYVSPNHIVVAEVLKEASRLLERSGHPSGLDGYQAGQPARSWMLAGAVWSALTGLGLSYAMPPASFEQHGQKVRDPGRVRNEGLATCLDSSLLLAACLEAAGLNPVVLFGEGHAWTGVWLTDRGFGGVTEPDVMTVRKAVDAHEFVMLETTLLTKRPTVGFEDAAAAGRGRVSEVNEHEFVMAVDIRRARAARIRPLASHHVADPAAVVDEAPASPAALPRPLDAGLLPGDLVDYEETTPAGRIARWQRKLLDLSLRNRLLNFKDSKQTLTFLCPDIATLEDQLSNGRRFGVLALKDEDPLGARDLLAGEERELHLGVARDALERGQLAVPLTKKEMNTRLLELFRRANSDMQEGGTNTLFLAIGFLKWRKTEGDTRAYRAPVLLLPVKLTRRSAQSEFLIEQHEDELRINATLLEFLKRDFSLNIPELEGELPRDDSGVDVARIFGVLRQRVRDVQGFEIAEDLALSTFSFAKFLMWKDLVERTDSLRESRLVRHLVDSPDEPFLRDGAPGLPDARDIDRRLAPGEMFTPLSADSSQLAAVLAAQDGHDFVLIGPPGTGKSQTIANIITQCLANGKTVLFVAEKSAALDVVHRRLAAHGLADAVLELHSSKSDRKSVLEQLGRSWDRASEARRAEWVMITNNLHVTRDQLNAYAEALHRRGTQGFSIYDAIGLATKASPPRFNLHFANRDAHDEESWQRLAELTANVARCWRIIDGVPPLDLVQAEEWSFGWEASLIERTRSLERATRDLLDAATGLRTLMGFHADPDGVPINVSALEQLTLFPVDGPDVSWALDSDLASLRHEASRLAGALDERRALVAGLSASYPLDRLGSLPLEKMDADWRLAHTKIWPMSALAKSAVRKLLQTYASTGQADPAVHLATLTRLRELDGQITTSGLASCPVFAGSETQKDVLIIWLDAAAAIQQALAALESEVADQQAWKAARRVLAAHERGALRASIDRFSAAFACWRSEISGFTELAGGNPERLDLVMLLKGIGQLYAQKARVSDWMRWQSAKLAADSAGLAPLVEALEAGDLEGDPVPAFKAAYVKWWLPLAIDASDALRRFARWSHEDAIERFRALDTQATRMAAAQVLQRVHHGLPAKDGVPRKSELGVLRHQLGLQRPSMPIRALIAEMPRNFTRLAPCVLMSPLSVAQYLPAGQAPFDVVVFDEASQITTWDAIGAIARGRQAIIVGDPKQLPPTNFFGRADGSDEDLPEVERDLASILDEAAAAGIPTRQLNWHYRSRDEALIAFSNWHYYGGRLVTFPSPYTETRAVQLHRINGVYGRGQGRTNEMEARAIVRMIVQRLGKWLQEPEAQRHTLGVITFNAEQQKLILDLLDEERRRAPELEWFFEDAREEPLIVKNLENIQGDERDVMLFSITFGPDAAGKLSMAFGALNGDGGEKRLNVAVTRARRELHVFASLHSDQIDLARTRALGVQHLKAFLDFAARGPVALAARTDGSLGPTESPFEDAVKAALEAFGWEVRSQIGVSGFRIDLGVVHPDHAGAFLAGVECDGATYHSSASARDRDKVRQGVLEGLGWYILRIWSTDWFRSPIEAAERVNYALSTVLKADRERRSEETEQLAETDEAVSGDSESALCASVPEPPENADPICAPSGPDTVAGERIVGHQPYEAGFTEDVQKQSGMALPPESYRYADPDQFFDDDYTTRLASIIATIVTEEGPLPLPLLARRVTTLHGWQRTGSRIAERIKQALLQVDCHEESGVTFVWSRGASLRKTPFRPNMDRTVRDISRYELWDLISTHQERIAASADPTRELARLMGLGRLTTDTRVYIDACMLWCSTAGPDLRLPAETEK